MGDEWRGLDAFPIIHSLCRSFTCGYCKMPIFVGDSVTVIKRGEFENTSLHASVNQPCAKLWYQCNPHSTAPPPLRFQMPLPELRDFLKEFALSNSGSCVLDMTVGGGKTNAMIYSVSVIRELIHAVRYPPNSVRVVCFNIEAKKELLRRGLAASEVGSFHSIMDRAYKVRSHVVNGCEGGVGTPQRTGELESNGYSTTVSAEEYRSVNGWVSHHRVVSGVLRDAQTWAFNPSM